MRAPGQLLLGLALLAGAAWVAPAATVPGEPGPVRPQVVPLARALQPLGPIKAVFSTMLWVAILDRQMEGDTDAVVAAAEGLLALHPGLEGVRSYLAEQLLINEAARAPDDARHRALVMRGFEMLEEGLALRDSPRLHGILGRLLMVQAESDPRFSAVAAQYFGDLPEEIAIDELRRADHAFDAVLLARLLVDRGLRELRRYDDSFAAERDLQEAERILRELPDTMDPMLDRRVDELRREFQALREDERS